MIRGNTCRIAVDPARRWRRVARSALGLVALVALVPGAALAAPQLFSFTSGTAALTVESGGTRLNDEAAVAALLGTYVEIELDPASGGPSLVDFELALDSASIAFDSPLLGVTGLALESATIVPDATMYASPPGSDLGSGEYAVGGGPLGVDVSYHLDTLGGPTPSISSLISSPGLTAVLDLDNGSLSLVGATLAILAPSETLPVPLVLKADITFQGLERVPEGAVPEPTGALLLFAGLGVSVGALRRRSAALAQRT